MWFRVRTFQVAILKKVLTSKRLRELLVHDLCVRGGAAIEAQSSPEEVWIMPVINFVDAVRSDAEVRDCLGEATPPFTREKTGALTLVLYRFVFMICWCPTNFPASLGQGRRGGLIFKVAFFKLEL